MASFLMVLEDGREAGGSLWAADDAGAVVRRIWYALPVVGAAMVVVASFVGEWRDAIGVAAGVGLAIVNFRFLHNGLRSILGAGRAKAPTGTTLMFVFRWVIVATVAYAVFRTGWASIGGIVAGMFAPVAAVTLEAIYQVVHQIAGRGGPGGDGK